AAAAAAVSLPLVTLTPTPEPARALRPVLGLTVCSGLTCELPPPPVFAVSLPINAIDLSDDRDSGSTGAPPTDAFLSRTMPSAASLRATWPCAASGIGV